MWVAMMNWWMLLRQEARRARSFALLNAGNSSAARMAMMAMTTRSSMRVKPGTNIEGFRPAGRDGLIAPEFGGLDTYSRESVIFARILPDGTTEWDRQLANSVRYEKR